MDPENYRNLLKKLNLESVRLIKSDSVLNLDNKSDGSVNIKDKVKIKETPEHIVLIDHTYILTVKAENTDSMFLKLSATFQLLFSIDFDYNEEFFDIYKNISLPLTTYPFFREFVFNTTARMNIQPLTLPLIIR